MKNMFSAAWKEAVEEASKDLHKHGEVTPIDLRVIGFGLIFAAWSAILCDLGAVASVACIFAGALGLISIFFSISLQQKD